MPLYSIVEFSDGFHLVASKWLIREQNLCWWPNAASEQEHFKHVKGQEYNGDRWECYPYIKILGEFDTFENARTSLRFASEESDLQSETEIKPRKRKQNKKYIESESDSDVNNLENEEASKKQKNEVSKKIKKKKKENETNVPPPPPFPRSALLPFPEDVPVQDVPVQAVQSIEPIVIPDVPVQAVQSIEPIQPKVIPEPNVMRTSSLVATEPCFSQSSLNEDPLNIDPAIFLNDTEFKKFMVREILNIKIKLTKKLNIENVNQCGPEPPLLPEKITTALDLVNFSNKIERSEAYCSKLVAALSKIGGENGDKITKAILSRLITPHVGTLFSWKGNKGKEKFCNLHGLLRVLGEAVRNTRSQGRDVARNFTDCDIKKSVAEWLRQTIANAKRAREKDMPQNERSE